MAITVGDLVVMLRGDTKQFQKEMEKIDKRLKKTGDKLQKTGKQMALKLSLPLAALGGVAAKVAAEFDTSLSQIVGLVGVAEDKVAAWRDEILALAPTMGKSSQEMGKAMFFITSAGLRGKTAMDALKASAMGAAAGLGETESVADAATSAMNAYGQANLDAEQAVAILVATVREGKAAAETIAPVLGRLLPVAAELGVGFDQVGAAIAAMTRLGFDAATSATSIRSTMVALLKPSQQARKALLEYGISFKDLRDQMKQEGMLSVLQRLKTLFGDNEEAMARVIPNVRALAGVLALVGKNGEASNKIFKSLAKTTGEDLNFAFKTAEKTAGFKFKAAMAEINVLMVRLGDVVLPSLVPLVEKFSGAVGTIADWLSKLTPRQREWLSLLGALGVAFGPVLWALGATIHAMRAILMVGGKVAVMITGHTVGWTVYASANVKAAAAARSAAIAMNLTRLGVVGLGLAIGYAVGTFFRPWIEKLVGLDDALFKVADRVKDLEAGLGKHRASFQAQLEAYTKLRQQLKLTGDEWAVNGEHTKENAKRLSELTEKAIAYAREAKRGLLITKEERDIHAEALDIRNRAAEQLKTKLAEANSKHKEFIDTLKEEHGLMTSEDIANNLKRVGEEMLALKDAGVDNNQIAQAYNAEMLNLLTLAKENKVAIPEIFKEGATAIDKELNPAIKKIMVDFPTNFQNNFVNSGKVIEGIMWSTGEKTEAALAGGFGRGVKKGVEEGKKTLQDFVKRIEDTVVYLPVQPDLEAWDRAWKDYQEGRRPDTTG